MSKGGAKQSKGADRASHGADGGVVQVRIPGPIAAWRLSMAVFVSAVTTGMSLLRAATTGAHLDLALGRSFGAACVVWFAAGRVNRVLVDVELRRRLDADRPGEPLEPAAERQIESSA